MKFFLLISLMIHIFVLMSWNLSFYQKVPDLQLQRFSSNSKSFIRLTELKGAFDEMSFKNFEENRKVAKSQTYRQKLHSRDSLNINSGLDHSEKVLETNIPFGNFQIKNLSFNESNVFFDKPNYPEIARRRNFEGEVVLELLLTKDGEIYDIKIVKKSGHEMLDNAAVESAKQWKFSSYITNYRVMKKIIFSLDPQKEVLQP